MFKTFKNRIISKYLDRTIAGPKKFVVLKYLHTSLKYIYGVTSHPYATTIGSEVKNIYLFIVLA